MLCRKSSSSTLYGVSCCHLPSDPIASHFLHVPRPIWPTLFFLMARRSHTPRRNWSTPIAARNFLAGRLLLDHRPSLYTIYLFFSMLQSSFIAALPAKVNRVRCASFFFHNCHICRAQRGSLTALGTLLSSFMFFSSASIFCSR